MESKGGAWESFTADAAMFRGGTVGREDVVAALGYWIGYPLLLEWVAAGQGDATAGRMGLDMAHAAATDLLMREAVKHGLDPQPLHECGCLVRRLYAEPGRAIRPSRGVYDVWPDSMEPWRRTLPAGEQGTLRAGESILHRLRIALDVGDGEAVAAVKRLRGRRGRKATYKPKDDAKIVADWEATKSSRALTQAEYERERGLPAGAVGKAQARQRKRAGRGTIAH